MTVWLSGCAWWTDDQPAPAGSLLGSTLRRRASGLTRSCADVLERLSGLSSIQLGRITTVYGSAYGEIRTTATLLQMMHDEHGGSSPTRFQASVHNTASGTISIACANRGCSISVAAGRATVAASLMEAIGVLATRDREVAVVVGEEPIPPPLTPDPTWRGLAVALHVTAQPRGAQSARLENLRLAGLPRPTAVQSPWIHNPCAPGLELALRWEQRQAGAVGLEIGLEPGWCCDLVFDNGRHGA